MDSTSEMVFDPETLMMLKTALDEAWDSLLPRQRGMTTRSELAERILRAAASGERDPIRLRTRALLGVIRSDIEVGA